MGTIEENYQVKYTNKWGSLLQQHTSRLEQYVTVERGLSGKIAFFDQFGVLDFDEKSERVQATTLKEAPTYRRSMRPRIFTKAIGFDEYDHKKLGDLDAPVSKAIEGLQSAAGRTMDKVILEAFNDINYVGEDGLTTVSFPVTQTVAVNYSESGATDNTNLTVEKLRATLRLFEENEAWSQDSHRMGDELVMAVTSAQIMSLLRSTEVSSYDFNNVKALAEGKIDSFMGFKFIRTQLLPTNMAKHRYAMAWVKSKAQFGIWDDFKVRISIRDDMEETLQIRAKFACGATRLQEEGFVRILCDESK